MAPDDPIEQFSARLAGLDIPADLRARILTIAAGAAPHDVAAVSDVVIAALTWLETVTKGRKTHH